ncbi:MAG: sugar phosphate isomerase/epimerase [Vicinamibacterales bacterium]|nr:sugar phosphate isomerase/epimerase [Vicinamibacterales bacterium]
MRLTSQTDTFRHRLNGTGVTRRAFLGTVGTASLAWALAPHARAAAAVRIPVAVQLYSLRRDSAQNFDAVLEQVAAMGFEGVEFAGYHTYAGRPADLAKKLQTLNLKVAGTHIQTRTLVGDALKATIDFHQAIGCKYLVVPSDAAFTDPEKSKALADQFNQIADVLRPLGMACGYHNHKNEFQKPPGSDKTYWDLFAERTSTDVILQMDCGWTMAAGYDPAAYIAKYPGRTKTAHFKPTVKDGDTGRKAILGQDSVDWPSTIAACASTGGTEWFIIEQEVYPDGRTPIDCTRDSLAGLRALL